MSKINFIDSHGMKHNHDRHCNLAKTNRFNAQQMGNIHNHHRHIVDEKNDKEEELSEIRSSRVKDSNLRKNFCQILIEKSDHSFLRCLSMLEKDNHRLVTLCEGVSHPTDAMEFVKIPACSCFECCEFSKFPIPRNHFNPISP